MNVLEAVVRWLKREPVVVAVSILEHPWEGIECRGGPLDGKRVDCTQPYFRHASVLERPAVWIVREAWPPSIEEANVLIATYERQSWHGRLHGREGVWPIYVFRGEHR
jgi:hypothetical protein